MPSAKENLIVAIDTPDLDRAIELAKVLKDKVFAVKLGLEFFSANGPKGVTKVIEQGVDIFLDLKFHDIPNTTAGAIREVTKLGVKMLTIHTYGSKEMMKAAVEAANSVSQEMGIRPPLIVGVTILTSIDKLDLSLLERENEEDNSDPDIQMRVKNLVRVAKDSGLDAIVCSAREVATAVSLNTGMKFITPGIRFLSDDKGDQKRVLTPKEALQFGADYLVMGRSITGTGDVLERVEYFNKSLL